MHFFNGSLDKSRLKFLILWLLKQTDEYTTLDIIEELKDLGFLYATKGGLSLSIDDLKIPPQKSYIVSEAETLVQTHHQDYLRGNITSVERIQQLVDIWHRASEVLKKEVINYFQSTDVLNPVYMMAFSGARGNISQVRQLVGMRGLMADPQGQIIGFPIKSNFREGLTVTEYMISCYGARKGLVDTALRTADAGYLTRRLVDVSQHVVVRIPTCSSKRGIFLKDIKESGKVLLSLKDRLIGRVLCKDFFDQDELSMPPSKEFGTSSFFESSFLQTTSRSSLLSKALPNGTSPGILNAKGAKPGEMLSKNKKGEKEDATDAIRPKQKVQQPQEIQSNPNPGGGKTTKRVIAFRNQEIPPDLAIKIASLCKKVLVRSPLTCSASSGICQMCYGWSLSEGRLVSLGEAVGIVAAQSIGEPGTQLTMRTFHTGGVFSGDVLDEIRSPFHCQVFFHTPLEGVLIRTPQGKIGFLTRTIGRLTCFSKESVEKKIFDIKKSSILFVRQNEIVPKGFLIAESPSLQNQRNSRAEGKRVVFSEISGQVFLHRMAIGKALERNGKSISSSRDLGSIWILSSKDCPTSSLLPFYGKGSHLVNENTLLSRVHFKNQNDFLQSAFSADATSAMNKTSLWSKGIFSFHSRKVSSFSKAGSFFMLKSTKSIDKSCCDKFFFPITSSLYCESFFWFFNGYRVHTSGLSWVEDIYSTDFSGGGFIYWKPLQVFSQKRNSSLCFSLKNQKLFNDRKFDFDLEKSHRRYKILKLFLREKARKIEEKQNQILLFFFYFKFLSILKKDFYSKKKASSFNNVRRKWVPKGFPIGKKYTLQGLKKFVPAFEDGWGIWVNTNLSSFAFFQSQYKRKIVKKKKQQLPIVHKILKRKDRAQLLKQILISGTIRSLISHSSSKIISNDFLFKKFSFLNEKNLNKKKTWKRNPMQIAQIFPSSTREEIPLLTKSENSDYSLWKNFALTSANPSCSTFKSPRISKGIKNLLSPKNPYIFENKNIIQKGKVKGRNASLHAIQTRQSQQAYKQNTELISLKNGWLYVPKKYSRIAQLHKSYRPTGTGYFEALEELSFEPWLVEIECLPRSFSFSNFSIKHSFLELKKGLFEARIAIWLNLFGISSPAKFCFVIAHFLKKKSLLQTQSKYRFLHIICNIKSRSNILSKKPADSVPALSCAQNLDHDVQFQSFITKRKLFPFFALVRKIDLIPLLSQKDSKNKFLSFSEVKISPKRSKKEQNKKEKFALGNFSFPSAKEKRNFIKRDRQLLLNKTEFSFLCVEPSAKGQYIQESKVSKTPLILWKSSTRKCFCHKTRSCLCGAPIVSPMPAKEGPLTEAKALHPGCLPKADQIAMDFQQSHLLHSLAPDISWQILPFQYSLTRNGKENLIFLNELGDWKNFRKKNRDINDDDSDLNQYDIFGQKKGVDQLSHEFNIEKTKRELIQREQREQRAKEFFLDIQTLNGTYLNNSIFDDNFFLYLEKKEEVVPPSLPSPSSPSSPSPPSPQSPPSLSPPSEKKSIPKKIVVKNKTKFFPSPSGIYLVKYHISPQLLFSPSSIRKEIPSLLELKFKRNFFSFKKFISPFSAQPLNPASFPQNHLLSSGEGEVPCQIQKEESQILLSSDDYTTFSLKEKKPKISVGEFVHIGQEIGEKLGTPKSGQIVALEKGKISLRRGQSILFYAGGINHVSQGKFVASHSPLLTLTYKKLITGDIVQGIPKIEQFFEAPITKDGEPLINSLGARLQHAFNRFKKKFSLPLAIRKSIAYIQEFVVEGIQKVYLSQGVLISDKHIEVIVRQMTSKGKIINGGNTGLLPGEHMNLLKIECINLSTRGERADYEPVILGITQASLDSDSFISAASFQETTRVLSRDSLEGKTDFLRGLKERVVLGDLIQAGTGLDENLAYGLSTKALPFTSLVKSELEENSPIVKNP